MTVSGATADLCPPRHVSHRAPQDAPGFQSIGLQLGGAEYSKVFGIINRDFAAQYAALVVELEGVVVKPVLDSNPIRSPSAVGLDVGGILPLKKTQHLVGAEAHHRM